MLFSGKIPFHVAARLTPRFWVPYLLRFATIRHHSRLFAIIRTIRIIRYSGLFAVRYSRLFTIRYSGFPDTRDLQVTRNLLQFVSPVKKGWAGGVGGRGLTGVLITASYHNSHFSQLPFSSIRSQGGCNLMVQCYCCGFPSCILYVDLFKYHLLTNSWPVKVILQQNLKLAKTEG